MYEELKLSNQLCFRLYTASRLLTQSYRPLLEPLGLTYPQYIVMMVLWEQDNLLVGDICKRLMLDTNTLTPLLKRMEQQGLVIRTKGIADGRQTLVSLTKKGHQLEHAAKDVPRCLTAEWQQTSFDQKQFANFVTMLDSLINMMKQ